MSKGGECGDEIGGGRGGRKGSRDIFNYQPEVPTLPLSPQLLAISCQIFPACHWTALALTIHLPLCYPFTSIVVVSTELFLIVTVSRLRLH